MQNFGQMMPRDREVVFRPINLIACNKREAFVQGSDLSAEAQRAKAEATRQSILLRREAKDWMASLRTQ